MRLLALALAAILLARCPGEAASNYRRPKNPKYQKQHKTLPRRGGAEAAAQPAGPPPLLMPGRWSPEVRRRLDEFIRAHGKQSPDFNPAAPPVAALALDHAAIVNDLGEAIFQRMVLNLDFKFDDDFWLMVPIPFGMQRLRADYTKLLEAPVSSWPRQPAYGRLRKGLILAYQKFCQQRGQMECRVWITRLFKGFTLDEAMTYIAKAIKDDLARPLEQQVLREHDGDRMPVVVNTGLRIVPEMEELVRVLDREGFLVLIVSEDAQMAVNQAASAFGLPADRGVGIKISASTTTMIFGGEVEQPVPFRAGKVAAVMAAAQNPPALVVGARKEDADLLAYGEGLRIVVDRGDPDFRKLAQDKGWLIQPAFPP